VPRLPVWVAKPLNEGWARTYNQFLELDYPPGEVEFLIQPELKNAFWLVYGWNYGHMVNPDGVQHYDSDFQFVWEQSGIRRFNDYMSPSMMDFTYPVFLVVTRNDPVYTKAINNTGETQTVDFTVFLIYFESEESFGYWSDWFEKSYQVPVPIVAKEGLEVL